MIDLKRIYSKRALGVSATILALTAMMMVMFAPGAAASGQSSARSLGMAGAFNSLAEGVDAPRYNPANLGLASHRNSSLELIGFGVNLNNNSITLGDYNKYTGAVLTDSDKEDILGKIPSDGLKLVAEVEASAFSFSLGRFAVSNTAVGAANVNLSKDILDLILNGNTLGDEIELSDSYSDAVAYVQTGFSYGLPIHKSARKQLAVGGTFKYIQGLAVEQITKLEGGVSTLSTGFEGSGSMIAQTATGGSGWGLDIGAAMNLNEKYTVGASIRNFMSTISWSNNTEEHGYEFSFDTMTVDNMDADYVVSEDYTREIDGFKTELPSVLTLGLADTEGKLLWAVDWEQGFKTEAGSSSKPRIALGAEYRGFGLLPLRAGFGTGGGKNSGFALGAGLNLAVIQVDFGVQTGTSLSSSSSKGLNMALGLRLDI